ncbi:type II toxin-antitoxin system RelE/ParE family toxin [Aromatoleum bremense]|uniref:type II toxin-antitoxin system RelE/ParE family toxin n=1 Tax=Aromatoleum bremense TaxID=76115 RepID=UPI001BB5F436|nr:type II toxin-antitoxin system RelE/ParE family toxin [Aromatoleum bremense]QTQ33555.1 Putative toxin-antitoxin system toxin, HigB/RelE [Aromatoleum bremense]
MRQATGHQDGLIESWETTPDFPHRQPHASAEPRPEAGRFLYKKRVARPGGGKSGGYRTLLSARIGSRYVFLHGFPKSDKANITQEEKKALQFAGKVFLELSAEALSKALLSGVLLEVHCEQDH